MQFSLAAFCNGEEYKMPNKRLCKITSRKKTNTVRNVGFPVVFSDE